jgi:2,3-dihydroxy-p-cumate/2,3-dihydroxybenzoate 3,4-dioxygenase
MIRHKKLSYLALNVSDLARSVAFYRDMVGLDLVEQNDHGEAFLSCNGDHHNLMLVQAKEASFKRVAFELEDESQIAVAEKVLSAAKVKWARIEPAECGRLRIGQGLRLADPTGIKIELVTGMNSRPGRHFPHPVAITHLSHVVCNVPDFANTLRFYTDVLNFRVSDYRYEATGERYFAFMRCFPNPYHHAFALLAAKTPTFFHMAFHAKTLDDLMVGRNRLLKAGVTVAPTPGRHMASGSVFQYFADPDGFTVEYTQGMEEFPEEGARQPRNLDKSYATTDIWEGEKPTNLPNFGRVEL